MKKIISMVLSFILILGCSTTAFAAETHNYDTENLPHDGADYFETEIKADEENEERISDFVTVYGYQYTKGSLKSGAWRNGTSGGSSTSSAKLSLNYTQDTSYNISFKASVSGGYTNGGTIGSELGVTLGASKSYSLILFKDVLVSCFDEFGKSNLPIEPLNNTSPEKITLSLGK